jgi:hypothetical protein
MSRLGSLYIELGEPEGELSGCCCEVGDWAACEIERLNKELSNLQSAANAVIKRWDSPMWKHQEHTGKFIDELRKAADRFDEKPVDFKGLVERL